jgi:hypothetical protein
MTTGNAGQIELFLQRYAAKRGPEHTITADALSRWWQYTKLQRESLLEVAKRDRREHARAHNLFRLFDLQSRESIHCRLLADFLDPEGLHGQGYLFLNKFLHHLKKQEKWDSGIDESSLEGTVWYVETEKGIEKGRIDIVASCRQLGCLIAIENKVYAGEQNDQICRYHQWLEAKAPFYGRRCLVFLTPTGRRATTDRGCSYIRMSYRSDIAAILQAATAQAQAPRVKATVQQYLDILNDLSDFREQDDDIRPTHNG